MQQINITNLPEWHQHVLDCYPEEACGFVIDGKFKPMKNVAEDPVHDFKIAGKDFLKAAKTKKLQAVIHSHPATFAQLDSYGNPFDVRTPSMSDLMGQQDTNLPLGIVSCDGEGVSDILWFGLEDPADLEGRVFIHNVYDCFTLVRDYYIKHMNHKMNIYPRPVNWKDFDKNIYEKNYQSEGLERINTDETEMKPGDIIFFHVMARNYIDHAGIYLGDNKFLHHQYNKLSTVESLDRWMKHIAYVIRKKETSND